MIVHYHNILSVVEVSLGNAGAELFNDDVIVQCCEESTLDDILVMSCTEVGCMLLSTVDDIPMMSCTEVGYMLLSTVCDILVMSFTMDEFVSLSTITYDTESNMINCITSLVDTVKHVVPES